MKHKILSIITALMMLSAVALITGCNNLQGNKPNNSSSQGSNGNNKDSNGGKQGNNENNQGNQNALVGVWKVTKSGNVTYPVNSPAGGTQQAYMAFTADGKVLMAMELKGFPSQNGLYRMKGGASQYKLLPGNKMETVEGGTVKTVSYTLSGNSLKIPDFKFEATKVTSPTEAQINAAPGMSNTGTPATKADLQGVWKVSAGSAYTLYAYFDGTTVYTATKENETFKKINDAIAYNETTGKITYNTTELTPFKVSDMKIELKQDTNIVATMIKDTSINPNDIKNAH